MKTNSKIIPASLAAALLVAGGFGYFALTDEEKVTVVTPQPTKVIIGGHSHDVIKTHYTYTGKAPGKVVTPIVTGYKTEGFSGTSENGANIVATKHEFTGHNPGKVVTPVVTGYKKEGFSGERNMSEMIGTYNEFTGHNKGTIVNPLPPKIIEGYSKTPTPTPTPTPKPIAVPPTKKEVILKAIEKIEKELKAIKREVE